MKKLQNTPILIISVAVFAAILGVYLNKTGNEKGLLCLAVVMFSFAFIIIGFNIWKILKKNKVD